MHSIINENDLVAFSDGLKVLVMEIYKYENEDYLLVKQVNSSETITIGNAFFLKVVNGKNDFECEYVEDDDLIYSLMDKMRNREKNR